jgi:hypothetical protein
MPPSRLLAVLAVAAAWGGVVPAARAFTVEPAHVCEVTTYRPWLHGSSFARAYLTLTGHPGVDPSGGGVVSLSAWSDHFGPPAGKVQFTTKGGQFSYTLPPVKLAPLPGQDMMSPTLRGRLFFGSDAYKAYATGELVFWFGTAVIARIPMDWGHSALRSIEPGKVPYEFTVKFDGCPPSRLHVELETPAELVRPQWEAQLLRIVPRQGGDLKLSLPASLVAGARRPAKLVVRELLPDGNAPGSVAQLRLPIETRKAINPAMRGFVTGMEAGVNRFGGDYKNVTTPTPDACQAACNGEQPCRAWTWVKSTSTCWLKNQVPAPSNDANCTSGVKR